MRTITAMLAILLLAGLAGAQTLPLTDLGTGHFSGGMGIYASGDTLALVYNNKPDNDPSTTGMIVFRKSTDGGATWNSVNVAPSQNCLTQPTLHYSASEIIITYASGFDRLIARSLDGGVNWQTWQDDPALNTGRTFENSPFTERRDSQLKTADLLLPYPEYAQAAYCQPDDPEELQVPQIFTDNDRSVNDTQLYYQGTDEISGVVRANSDIWIRQAGGGINNGWPTFHAPVIIFGEVHSASGAYPEDQIFLGGLIENAPDLEIFGSPRHTAQTVGPAYYDPDRIMLVDVNGTGYTAYMGMLTEPETVQIPVYASYPPAGTADPLYYNSFTVRDTVWSFYSMGSCANSTNFVHSKLWIKGNFYSRQTWAAADTIYLVGSITLANTPVGQAPTDNQTDFVNLISEKSILLKYGYCNPVDSLRRHPFCGSDPGVLPIYANLFALGKSPNNDPRKDGVFTFEYQHPHPSVPAYNYNGTLYDNIDLHRYRYPQEPGFPWATTSPGNPQNLKIDLPWYNPLWPERTPYLERGTIKVWGSIFQNRRGFLHRPYYDVEWPSNGVWDPPQDLCGGSSSPAQVQHVDPVLGIELINVNYPGATGSGVGYKKQHAHDPRHNLSDLQMEADIDVQSMLKLGLALCRQTATGSERYHLRPQLRRTRSKDLTRLGDHALYSVNDLLLFAAGDEVSDWSASTESEGLIRGMELAPDGSALICQYRYEDQQLRLKVSKLAATTGSLVWERDYQACSQLNDIAILPNGQQLLAKYEDNGYLWLWLLTDAPGEQLVRVWETDPYTPDQIDLAGSRLVLKAINDETADIFLWLRVHGNGENQPGTVFHARSTITVPVSDPVVPPVPEARLSAWPNPASGQMNIKLELSSPMPHQVEIYNLRGQRIRTLSSAVSNASGEYEYLWNGLDQSGKSVGAGVFFLRASADGVTLSTKRICRVR
ncbi:MAG: T9SS type A sorting domain-containing protein [Candidatus Syntrophosphaera sp.]|nr:T9SS type A sorting domain-containing protein [Candidatus Syntrophosphaera sp.]